MTVWVDKGAVVEKGRGEDEEQGTQKGKVERCQVCREA